MTFQDAKKLKANNTVHVKGWDKIMLTVTDVQCDTSVSPAVALITCSDGRTYHHSVLLWDDKPVKAKKPTKKKSNTRKIGKQAANQKPRYCVYSDGGCDVNPGGRGGYGVVIIKENADGTKTTETLSGAFASTTNNRMEIMAAIVALEHIEASADVTLVSDSQYLINTAEGMWQRKKNNDLWDRLDRAMAGKNIKFIWVRGHSGDKYNEQCDQMATKAIHSGPYASDGGYQAESTPVMRPASTNRQPGGAMGVAIDIDAGMDPQTHFTSMYDLKAKRKLNDMGARTIYAFLCSASPKGFKNYASLKTGGMDAWSQTSPLAIIRTLRIPETLIKRMQSVLPSGQDQATALRWYARGLCMKDAIRKVLVNNEIAANAHL